MGVSSNFEKLLLVEQIIKLTHVLELKQSQGFDQVWKSQFVIFFSLW